MVNVRRRRRPARTSAASAWSLVPVPHATAPALRQGGLATVATRASAAVAPTRWRRSTGSSVKRTIVKRAASLLDFDNVLVGRSTPPFPSSELVTLSRTTTTRTNWGGAETTTPPDTQYCPSTIRSMSALRGQCCRLSSNLTRTMTTMTHHPLLLALRPMGAMHQQCQPLLSTVQSMGATPPPGINYCSRLAGRWERFAGGRRCHGCWFHWQQSGSRWQWCHGCP